MDAPPVADGAVVLEAGRIAWVGRRVNLPEAYRGAPVRDFPRSLVLPGFVNAHCHLYLTGSLGRIPRPGPDGFVGWLRAVIGEQARWTPEIPRLATRAGLDLLANRGVTTVGDLARTPQIEEVAAGPLRSTLFLETIAFPRAGAGQAEGAARAWLDRFPAAAGGCPRVRPGLAPHAPYSVSAELAGRLAALARERNLPLAVHLAETEEEIRFLKQGGGGFEALLRDRGVWDESWRPPGVSPVRWAADLGLLECRGAAVHLNCLAGGDVELLKQGNLVPVWCPGSHGWFGREAHPAAELLAAGLPVALGTDSLASNTGLDMLAEMRLAAATFPDVPGETWLRAATLWAARACGWEDESGSLTPGKAADLVVLESESEPGSEPWPALLGAELRLRVMLVAGEEIQP